MHAIRKFLVSDKQALTKKYGAAGRKQIEAAVQALAQADAARGIQDELVFLDVAGPYVKQPLTARDRADYKRAIDALWNAAEQPQFLAILGGPDIVPFQELTNPTFGPDDEDQTVPSDLPYACNAPFGTDPTAFLGPTRVVGRIPDLAVAKDLPYFLGVLGAAAGWKTWTAKEQGAHFGLSAQVWKGSTAKSLVAIYGSSAGLVTSPPQGPQWTPAQLAGRTHFVNCHGAPADPKFYGQHGTSYPAAEDAALLGGAVGPRLVVAAECCYGAALYDPSLANGQMGICSTVLGAGGYGFFGSSTIAYGPANDNSDADLICRYFLQDVLKGASLGEATLDARQRFVAAANPMSPTELKTLAQFYLLGDPSIEPAAKPAKSLSKEAKLESLGIQRSSLAERGKALGTAVATASVVGESESTDPWQSLAAQFGIAVRSARAHEVEGTAGGSEPKAKTLAAGAAAEPRRTFHLLFGNDASTGTALAPKVKGGPDLRGRPERHTVVLVVLEVGGTVASARKLYQR